MLTDFHTHILPGIDDGSRNVEESVQMLRMEAEQGIECVVATPHFYASHDDPERFLARREDAYRQLREATAAEELPQVLLGAEVHYFRGISDSEALSALTIEKKGCILIEMPPAPWTEQMYRELEGIYEKQGLIPVIAHVDRYISPLRTYRIPQRLSELPVAVQANASFFLNRSTSGFALRLLRQGAIQLLGSDCHNLQSRAPNMAAAVRVIRKRAGQEALEQLRENGERLLNRANQTC